MWAYSRGVNGGEGANSRIQGMFKYAIFNYFLTYACDISLRAF